MDNKVEINGKKYQIKATKMKYIKEGFYLKYNTIVNIGFSNLVANYTDGIEIITDFIRGAFALEEVSDELFDNLDATLMKSILEKIKEINEIKDEPKNDQGTPKE